MFTSGFRPGLKSVACLSSLTIRIGRVHAVIVSEHDEIMFHFVGSNDNLLPTKL